MEVERKTLQSMHQVSVGLQEGSMECESGRSWHLAENRRSDDQEDVWCEPGG